MRIVVRTGLVLTAVLLALILYLGFADLSSYRSNIETAVTEATGRELKAGGVRDAIMVDASHANCGKDHEQMPAVFESVVDQRVAGDRRLIGAMLESHLLAGSQEVPEDRASPSPIPVSTGKRPKESCWRRPKNCVEGSGGE